MVVLIGFLCNVFNLVVSMVGSRFDENVLVVALMICLAVRILLVTYLDSVNRCRTGRSFAGWHVVVSP